MPTGEQSNKVNWALRAAHPPGSGRRWCVGISRWKPGFTWFDAEESVDLVTIANEALDDPDLVEVVPLADAFAAEHAARSADARTS